MLKVFNRSTNITAIRIFGAVALLGLFLTTGCGSSTESVVKKIHVLQGENQCAAPETECKIELIFELLGPKHPGLFGGKGSSSPVSGIKVTFKPLYGSDIVVTSKSGVSNAGGAIIARIRTGKKRGDQYFKIIPEGFPKAARIVRVISGISVQGAEQEAFSGEDLPNPISITVYGKDGKPAAGVPVYFHIASSPEKKIKAKFKKSKVLTDENGTAESKFKMGTVTGTYKLVAEVVDSEREINYRGIEIKALGLNLMGFKGLILTVLGGLALFIFGMKQMSDGLQLVAGDKMKSILHFFTRNRFVAVCAGALITGIIQSSSACTVMVVGFVNAGLLNLMQAIGVVFGANIGTTITAQMISLKLGGLAFPAIICGLLFVMLAKKTTTKGWGQTLLGFGLLFFGLGVMGGELKVIGKFPTFIDFFNHFDCTPIDGGYMPLMPVFGAILIGTLLTFAIQSSSASMGIVLMLAGGGLINFWTAVPLLLGTNIGTTITAILASIGANERARQTAVAHVLFNMLGTLLMVGLFYVPYGESNIPIFLYFVNSITQGDVFAYVPENIVRHIAMAHTFFNVFIVILFMPFIGLIAKFCNIVIKIPDDKKIRIEHLEPHLLDTPSIAIEQTIQSIRHMVKESWKMVTEAMEDCFMNSKLNDKISKDLTDREERIDGLQKDVTEYLVQITERTLTEPQAGIVPLLMHCTNDAERIADHTENILALTKRLMESKNKISPDGQKDLKEIWDVLKQQAEHVIAALDSTNKSEVHLAKKSDLEVDKLADRLEINHVNRLKDGKCKVDAGIIFLETVSDLEKIGDHLGNIAERTSKIQKHHLELGG